MPTLICLKENGEGSSPGWPITVEDAAAILLKYDSKFYSTVPNLKSEKPRAVPAGFRDCDLFAVHLESGLGGRKTGCYVFQKGQPSREEVEAIRARGKGLRDKGQT